MAYICNYLKRKCWYKLYLKVYMVIRYFSTLTIRYISRISWNVINVHNYISKESSKKDNLHVKHTCDREFGPRI